MFEQVMFGHCLRGLGRMMLRYQRRIILVVLLLFWPLLFSSGEDRDTYPDILYVGEAPCEYDAEQNCPRMLNLIDLQGDITTLVIGLWLSPETYQWSPDGSQILYRDEGTLQLYDMESAVSTPLAPTLEQPAWTVFSPDGDHLLLTNQDASFARDYDLYLLDLQSGELSLWLEQLPISGQPVWSPDGSYLLISVIDDAEQPALRLYRVNRGDTTLERITGHDDVALEAAPAYSPDGTQMVFTAGNVDENQLYLMEVGTGEVHQLTEGPDAKYTQDWSPDGQFVLFHQQGGYRTRPDPATLQLLHVDTGEIETLVTRPVIGGASWSPDGSQIAFTGGRRSGSDLCLYDLAAHEENCFEDANPFWLSVPLWRPTS
jgi:Tol biopolymer transport system component